MSWVKVCEEAELPAGSRRVHREGRLQVAIFRLAEGGLYALDNRCPHEGYPLTQGALDGCTLTCLWHNYKFDLRDGACLKGDEAVRTFPVRVRDGVVELDLTLPPPGAEIPRFWASFQEGLGEMRVGQATRDAARLLEAGVSPAALAASVAAWAGERAEYGAGHVLAVAADVLRWQDLYAGPRFAIPLAQLLDLAAEEVARRSPRPSLAPVDPGPDPVVAGRALRTAVEAEDAPLAEALLAGALARGWGRAELEPWFFHLCADHFLSFGHRLIYQIKAFDLLDAAGWAPHAPAVLRSHLFGIINGTREDLLPPWAAFRDRLAALDLPALYAGAGQEPGWPDQESLRAALLDGRPRAAVEALTEALEAGAPLSALVDVLSLAAAERMLRFDTSIDGDAGNQDGWLSVTHIQTYANALRHAVERFDHPDVLKLVYYGARMVNHHRVLDLPPERRAAPLPAPAARPEPGEVRAAVRAGRAEEAMAMARALLSDPAGRAGLREALMEEAISDRFVAPIVSAHAMKNLVAAWEELEQIGDSRPVLAVVRLLSGPLQQRWTHRGALEAVAFVTEGRIPHVLAP